MKEILRVFIVSGILILSTLTLNGCDTWWFETAAFGHGAPSVQKLRVAMMAHPLTYQVDSRYQGGFEHDLLQHFAANNGYQIQIVKASTESEVFRLIESGQADLGAGRLPAFVFKNQQALIGPAYDEQRLSLVCPLSRNVEFSFLGEIKPGQNLKILTTAKSVDPDWLPTFTNKYPDVEVQVLPTTVRNVLALVSKSKQSCALLDRFEADYFSRQFPHLRLHKDLKWKRQYHFAVSPKRSDLQKRLRIWFPRAARSLDLSRIRERYQFHLSELDLSDQLLFQKMRGSRLKAYEKHFRKYAKQFGVPWTLVAAVAYQESHWNPEAVSFTGVRGLMQLTRETAEHLGVEDRTDPVQSIWGGAKYLRTLYGRTPSHLPDRERWAMALATYNVGPAHMIDAQTLAQKLGMKTDCWKDLRAVLPKLSNPKYFKHLRYGPARGEEPVDFVRRVFSYWDLLKT